MEDRTLGPPAMTQTSRLSVTPNPSDVAAARAADTAAIARGLPPRAYISEDFFTLENETLFANGWVFAGFAHEMAAPGDVVPVTVAGRPLMLVRGRDGEIRAFHNVCRHRCATLVEQPGNVGRVITCPYHAWAYGLDGALRTTPHFAGPDRHDHPGLDRAAMGLKPVRSGLWQDWIFVNLSGTAIDFEDFVAPIARRLAAANLARLTPVATIDLGEVRTNWKFLMDLHRRALPGQRRRDLGQRKWERRRQHARGRFLVPDPVSKLRAGPLSSRPARRALERAAGCRPHAPAAGHLPHRRGGARPRDH
jgi:nitrite reductase/ring-hydroxylating ferredoxin subunit